jgi:hypothetical protein
MTSVNSWGEIRAGSYATVAEPVIRFTFAVETPGVFSSDRCIRALQAAQVIPVT